MAAPSSSTSARLRHAVSAGLETLELRRMFCVMPTASGVALFGPTSDVITDTPADPGKTGPVKDHARSWYKAAKTVKIKPGTAAVASRNGVVTRANNLTAPALTITTNAAGLPLLSSRADGSGLEVFLDFDGYNDQIPFDMTVAQGGDNNGATFNLKEQTVIYNAWRDIVSYFSMFDVNVTTIQPPVGGTNPAFVWQRITDSESGGAASVGAINNTTSRGYTDDANAISRTSGIAHEIGHQLNLNHQSEYDDNGDKTLEYSSGYIAHGPMMGVDFAQGVHKWFFGRNTSSADTLQDDLTKLSAYIVSKTGSGDGFMPDDFTGTTLSSAAAMSLSGVGYSATGSIERASDADYFSFNSSGGIYDLSLLPTYRSAIAPKFDLYDAGNNLIAAKDDTSYLGHGDNTGQEIRLALPAGTYYVKVAGHGDYGDVGEYGVTVSPLPANFKSTDIVSDTGTMGIGGAVNYNGGVFAQTVGGAGMTGASDAVRFTYVVLNGNGSFTAKLDGITSDTVTNAPRAGISLRETLASNARNATLEFSPTNLNYGGRTTVGGSTSSTSRALAPGNWIRLVRTGNSVAMYSSTDGVNFGSAFSTTTISGLATQIYIGLTTASRDPIHLTTATFSSVAATGTLVDPDATQTFNNLAAPTNLTAMPVAGQSTAVTLNWNDNASDTGYAVERSVDGVTWSQVATLGISSNSYTDNPGFGSMRWWYRVTALFGSTKSAYSNVAAVINKPAAPTNPQAVAISTTKLSLTWRDTSGDTGYRVERSSDGGATWTNLTPTPLAANITGLNVSTGLAAGTAYSFRVTPLSTAGDGVPLVFTGTTALPAVTNLAFTNKAIGNVGLTWSDIVGETGYRIERSTDRVTWAAIGTAAAGVTTYTDTTALALTHYYYRVFGTAAEIESENSPVIFFATPASTPSVSPWASTDLGSVGGTGTGYTGDGATATVIGGGGAGVGGVTADTQHFLYRTLSGDGEIVARVSSLEVINELTKAGVMFRESLAAGSKYVATTYQTPDGGYGTDMSYRTTTNGGATNVDGTLDKTYTYLRLVRSGNVFTAYMSQTGAAGSWTQIGAARTVTMASTVYVGLWASARDNNYLSTTTFDNVSITPTGLAAPAISSFVLNNGATQRSMVQTLSLNFNQPVFLTSAALTLQARQPDGSYATSTEPYTLSAVNPSGGYAATYTLTFTGTGGSIADGRYRVVVAAATVKNSFNTAMAASASYDFFRLYGDADGDAGVSINDFNALSTAFGSTLGNAVYNAAFDSDGDNGISINDFNAFAARFGLTI